MSEWGTIFYLKLVCIEKSYVCTLIMEVVWSVAEVTAFW